MQKDIKTLFTGLINCSIVLALLGSTNGCAQNNAHPSQELHLILKDTTLRKGDIVNLPIFYDLDGGQPIRKGCYPYIKQIATYLDQNPNHIIEIGSHTDQRASFAYNKDLTTWRCKKIKKLLLDSFHADISRVLFYGYGKSHPLISQDSIDKSISKETLYQQNRRTEFKLIDTTNNKYLKKYGLNRERDSIIWITKSTFFNKLRTSDSLVRSMPFDSLKDNDHKQIIRLINTITFNDSVAKYPGALQFEKLLASYSEQLTNRYEWIPNRGMGFYVLKLKVELGGTPSPNSFYFIIGIN